MLKKSLFLMLALIISIVLVACNGSTAKNETTNPPVTQETSPSTASVPEAMGPGVEPKEEAVKSAAPASIPYNVPAGDDVVLPKDIPSYPSAQMVGKRITNKIHIFDFKTDASLQEITKFYQDELKRLDWRYEAQQPNSVDGMFYTKTNRSVRIIPIDLKDKGREIHIFVAETSPITTASQPEDGPVPVANVGELMKINMGLVDELSPYPNAKQQIPSKRNYRNLTSTDPVNKIADWYGEQLKAKGWQQYNNTSEMGDSMVIYTRKTEDGTKQFVAVRVVDQKQERQINLIVYPNNATVPILKPLSEVAKESKTVSGDKQK